MGQLFKGDTGKTFRVNAGYDISSYTELTLTFKKPDGTEVTKTASGGEVTLGTSTITQSVNGVDQTFTLNEYVEYVIEVDFLDLAGEWCVYLTYTNTGATPDDIFNGAVARFEVKERC